MQQVRVASVADLERFGMVQYEREGERYVVVRDAGEVFVLDGVCPHRGAHLAHGNLERGRVICPWHAWSFDCRTGEDSWDPQQKLRCFPAEVRDGEVFAEFP